MAGLQISTELKFANADWSRPRIVVEREKLALKFPSFSIQEYGGTIESAQGLLRTIRANTYFVSITVTGEYPYVLPSIWLPYENISDACPHRFRDGSICVMKSSRWSKIYSIAVIVALTAKWLDKYEVWKRTYHWPGKEQSH